MQMMRRTRQQRPPTRRRVEGPLPLRYARAAPHGQVAARGSHLRPNKAKDLSSRLWLMSSFRHSGPGGTCPGAVSGSFQGRDLPEREEAEELADVITVDLDVLTSREPLEHFTLACVISRGHSSMMNDVVPNMP